MEDFEKWIFSVSDGSRPIFISDNIDMIKWID